jgi:hypothetical protein
MGTLMVNGLLWKIFFARFSMHVLIPTVMLTSWGAEVSAVIYQKNL